MKSEVITTEKLDRYINDYRSTLHYQSLEACGHSDDFIMNSTFWAYVAGREHGKEVCPPIKPVKASWVIPDGFLQEKIKKTYMDMAVYGEAVMDLTHPLDIK